MVRLTIAATARSTSWNSSAALRANRLIETVHNGVEVSPLKVIGDTERRGTEVHFCPTTEIFQQTTISTTTSCPSACANSRS
jgi:DNA gyrase subunit B